MSSVSLSATLRDHEWRKMERNLLFSVILEIIGPKGAGQNSRFRVSGRFECLRKPGRFQTFDVLWLFCLMFKLRWLCFKHLIPLNHFRIWGLILVLLQICQRTRGNLRHLALRNATNGTIFTSLILYKSVIPIISGVKSNKTNIK